ncbi:MAG: NAD-dependent epimerase/dehydratase family protein [Armatimonadota bacterium]|nr:NAD-dependent epimerase/dehydratase family protein [Armatimonadota bacterium]
MNILVTGGTGYVGNAVVAALCRAGHDVAAIVRSRDKARLVERFGARAVDGDITRPETLSAEVKRSDAVVHTAAEASVNTGTIDRRLVEFLLDAIAQSDGLRRFVYTSGVWVLGDTGGKFVDETASTEHPAAIVAWRPAVEELIDNGMARGITAWTIRPGVVYGGSGGITGMMFTSAEKEGAVRIIGDGRNHWAIVHRDDLADLYVRVVEQAPAGHIFNATDGSRLTVRTMAEALSRAAGCGGKVISTPPDEARKGMGPFADALALDQHVSAVLAERLLGWEPKHRSLVGEAEALWRSYKAGA